MMNEPFNDEILQYFGPICEPGDPPEESGARKLDRALKDVDNPKPFQEEAVDKFEWRMEALTPLFKRLIEKVDTVEEFVKEMCELLDYKKIESSRLYRHYEAWCLDNKLRSVSRSVFCKRLLGCFPSSVDFRPEKYSTGYFMGIGLKEKL